MFWSKVEKSSYEFRKSKDGYLIYRRQWRPLVRRLLTNLYLLIDWIQEKKDESERINREILGELGLSLNTKINTLDAYFKKEFRKRKHIYYSENKFHEDFPEPKEIYRVFMPGKYSEKSKASSIEFFKNFNRDSR